MLVVADSSPVHYLILIRQAGLLQALFGEIFIPPQVADELSHPSAPQAVRDFMAQPPGWLSIRTPRSIEHIPRIDGGEEAAISLAREIGAHLLLIDDLDGRAEARRRGLRIVGTLGVIELAADRSLVDLRAAIHALQQTSMHLSDELIQSLLKHHE